MATVEERIAVVETQNKEQSKDIQEILNEVKSIAAFIYEYKPKMDALEGKQLPKRVTAMETKITVVTWLLVMVAGLAASKEWITKLLFG